MEAELRSLKPAQPPAVLVARLRAVKPAGPAVESVASAASRPGLQEVGPELGVWHLLLRWLPLAAACIATGVIVWRVSMPARPQQTGSSQALAPGAQLKADDVRIGRELVTSFDTVALLPSGEPVRFRCQEWMDKVVWRDTHRGVTVEQRTPRFEVVPVRFETY